LIGSRIISNIAYPNKGIKDEGFESFKGVALGKDLQQFSTKFYEIMKRIDTSPGPVFVYSNFLTHGGLLPFIQVLKHRGYTDVLKKQGGKLHYAVWSGSETSRNREMIRNLYNSDANMKGRVIKVIIGSPAMKEGISLFNTRQIHILEPYWNMSRLWQIIGRGIRFCSHKNLPARDRKVNVYMYLATTGRKEESIDEYIWRMAQEKEKLTQKFMQVVKDVAIDRELFQ
jgi:SNF2 family DNA or RNA helicase